MTDEPDNLTLRMLRKIDAKLDSVGNDVRDLKFRVGQLEAAVSHLSIRMDRIDERMERIEKRLDLVDA